MRLYLIRHAQSENNVLNEDTIHHRKVDPGLTPLGHQQREFLASYLASELPRREESGQITHLLTSAMYRSLLTAKPASEALGLRPTVWPDLHELGGLYLSKNGKDTGFGGMTRSAILQEFQGFELPCSVTESGWYEADMGIEPTTARVDRAHVVARTLRDWSETERVIALISHAGFLSLLLQAIHGDMPLRKGWRYYHNNTAVTRIDYHGTQPIMHYMNRVEHLSAELRTF